MLQPGSATGRSRPGWEESTGEQHSWVSSRERGHHSPGKQGMNEVESAPRQQQVSLQKCCCWARGQQGHRTHHWHRHHGWQHHSEEPTSWPNKIYYSSPKTKQLETHTQQRLEGEAWPWSQSGAESRHWVGHPGSAGAQEFSTGHLTANGHPEQMQRRAQAHPFLLQPLLPPQFTGLVFSFPRWATPSQKRLEQQDEPFGAGGALQFLMAAVPKESNGQ